MLKLSYLGSGHRIILAQASNGSKATHRQMHVWLVQHDTTTQLTATVP